MQHKSIRGWQIYLGFLGTIVWLGTLQALDYIRSHGWVKLADGVSGYTIGFITAIAGYLFWEFAKGRSKRFLGEKPGLRWASAIPLLVICVFGLVGFIKEIFSTYNAAYNLAGIFGGIVVSQGLMPLLENLQEE